MGVKTFSEQGLKNMALFNVFWHGFCIHHRNFTLFLLILSATWKYNQSFSPKLYILYMIEGRYMAYLSHLFTGGDAELLKPLNFKFSFEVKDLKMYSVLSFRSSLSSLPGYTVQIHSSHSPWLAGMYSSSESVHACGSMHFPRVWHLFHGNEKWTKMKEVEDVEQVLG